jgi:hypothetical protein
MGGHSSDLPLGMEISKLTDMVGPWLHPRVAASRRAHWHGHGAARLAGRLAGLALCVNVVADTVSKPSSHRARDPPVRGTREAYVCLPATGATDGVRRPAFPCHHLPRPLTHLPRAGTRTVSPTAGSLPSSAVFSLLGAADSSCSSCCNHRPHFLWTWDHSWGGFSLPPLSALRVWDHPGQAPHFPCSSLWATRHPPAPAPLLAPCLPCR